MRPLDTHPANGTAQPRGDIAIVGMACLFPGAPDLDAYWRNILGKVDAVSDPPAAEWDPESFYDPQSTSNDRIYCKRGGYIGDLSYFRPFDFGVMPVTVDGGEPDQWLALQLAHEALADAGYAEVPREHARAEVILGKGTYVNRGNLTVGYHGMLIEHFLQALRNLHPDYTDSEIAEIKKELKAALPPFNADTAPALIGNIIAGRIANRLDLMGPSFTVDAACASALLAIDIGVRDLLSNKCDLVLAGGANVHAPLPTLSLFCQLGALSRREQIRPFDKNADGTLLGEGLGIIVLKRREDAERDDNRIYALIKGVGLASDGRAVHVMAPRVEGEELALRRAYQMSGVSPETVGLIEAHGTATPLGDVVEVQALSRLFGERRGLLPTCALGSVKSMIGHTMPAAGIAGVIKAALALYHRVLPPTINCEEPNPLLQLDKTPLYVNTETRPWIHGAATPRRAGVNAFGFGGINAHVVLEGHPSEATGARNHQLYWDTEVCIIEAESRKGLIERCDRLSAYLATVAEAPLKDIGYTLNTALQGQPFRLAIVASSKDELAQRLSVAMRRMADPQCRQIKDNAGIYFFDQPLKGKLAFLFPGEGAQYPNMLLDLCVHFPEVRRCFDLADRALAHGSRKILPSDLIFPRSILAEPERSEVDRALWRIDGAVEGVLIGNWAMWTLLNSLEIRPDRILGHSTGDYSAMLASGIINVADEEEYVQTILEWNKAHSRLVEQMEVPKAALVAVAADSATVASILEETGEELYLAMDNCPHQSVLVGSRDSAERVIEHFRRRGIIYEVLPFDRPYHTPMFEAYAHRAGEEFFARLHISAPAVETYSCTTASLYPTDITGIRNLFVAHWVRPVLFTQTVKKMYDDGVRLFVEAGPRGNLISFVSDILRGKPHLAMPANLPRRSGLAQINHLVGILAAQCVPMRLNYLYARRNPKRIPWEEAQSAAAARQTPAPMKLSLGLPVLTVSRREPRPVAPVHDGSGNKEAALPGSRNTSSGVRDTPIPVGVAEPGDPFRAPASSGAPAHLMQEYLKGMEKFLEVETQVMGAYLNRLRKDENRNGIASQPAPRDFPLLGTITSVVPGEELIAVRQLSLEDDLFLCDHALGGTVSLTDPGLRPLIVLPLTMSMEVLAEAAAALMPGQILVGMRNIRAAHWIQVDHTAPKLQISARRLAGANEVSVQIRNLAEANDQTTPSPVVEGIMIFADQYPAPPTASSAGLNAERTSQLASGPLYDGRRMFHGPCFQGVARVDRSGENGVTGKLRTLPTTGLFRQVPDPRFVTAPVVLDAAGQLVGFWAAENLPRGFVVFPYQLDSLRIYGPNRPVGEYLDCRATLRLIGSEGIRSDIEIGSAGGKAWMQLQGWFDRRFDPPSRFHRAWVAPREATISEPWPDPFVGLCDQAGYECYRLESVFDSGTRLWKSLWASLILSRQERRAFGDHLGSEDQQMDWLSRRTVAKDAVRSLVRKRHGLELLPADIEIGPEEHGVCTVSGAWVQQLPSPPVVCLAAVPGLAVALAVNGSTGRRWGIEVQALRDVEPDFAGALLVSNEQQLLNTVPPSVRAEWFVRLICVKGAASKALARGLTVDPRVLRISALDPHTGAVQAALQGVLGSEGSAAAGPELLAYTVRDGLRVLAIAVYEERTS